MKHQSRIRNITGLALGLQLLALLFLDGATSRLAAAEPLQWLGNTWHWLADGAIYPQEDLWISCETWPAGTATRVETVYSIDGGLSWSVSAMVSDGQSGNNDRWHVNLGAFAFGTTIRYAVVAEDALGTKIWDNNGGADYTVNVPPPVITQVPANGALTCGDDLRVIFDVAGADSAFTLVEVVYSLDGENWLVTGLALTSAPDQHHWEANLGRFAAGSAVRYVLVATDRYGNQQWFNNQGSDYTAIVDGKYVNLIDPVTGPNPVVTDSGSYSENYSAWKAFDGIEWSKWISDPYRAPVWVGYQFDEPTRVDKYVIAFSNGASLVSRAPKDFELQGSNNGYAWVTVDTRTGQTGWRGEERRTFYVSNPGEFASYRLLVHDDNSSQEGIYVISIGDLELYQVAPWISHLPPTLPPTGTLTSADDMVVSFDATCDQRGYSLVEVVYSVDGETWEDAPLALTAQANQDHWEVNLGRFAAGAVIRYALVATESDGDQQWFNNAGDDYAAVVAATGEYVDRVIQVAGPSAVVAESGVYGASYPGWQAFDGNDSTSWISAYYQAPAWVSYEFPVPTRIDRYSITCYNASLASRSPKDFQLQGSNGGGWETLDTRSGETAWAHFERRSYVVSDPGVYQSYRLLITDDNDNRAVIVVAQISELQLEQQGQPLVWHSPANGKLTSLDNLTVAFDGAGTEFGYSQVEVVYSTDGVNWSVAPMAVTRLNGYDHWEVNLGAFAAGSSIQYALVSTDAEGNQEWFNNGGADYTATVAP